MVVGNNDNYFDMRQRKAACLRLMSARHISIWPGASREAGPGGARRAM